MSIPRGRLIAFKFGISLLDRSGFGRDHMDGFGDQPDFHRRVTDHFAIRLDHGGTPDGIDACTLSDRPVR